MILVTRPAPAGPELARQLAARACSVYWWPAFDVRAPADPAPLRAAIEALAQFDLVVFVSPTAVQAFADAARTAAGAPAPWPAGTVLAAVGAASLQAALQLPGAAAAHHAAPAGQTTADGGSEALWPVLAALQPMPRRALIVRAQSGRAWLAQQLADSGVRVQEVEAYQRCAHAPGEADWAALHGALARGERLAVLFSSSEAVGAITPVLRRDAALAPWIDAAIGLAVHPRIGQALRAAGWRDVRDCEASVAALEAALAAERGVLGATGANAPPPASRIS